MKKRHTKYT